MIGVLQAMVIVAGCDQGIAPELEEPLVAGDQEETFDPRGEVASLAAPLPQESAVHLLLDSSPINPWCSGVLVAPDVVMTSAECVFRHSPSKLSVGLYARGDGTTIGVERVEILEHDERLAALVLAEPAEGIEPAELAELTDERCDVHSVSYLFVLEREPEERWTWTGCYSPEDQVLRPVEGSPNCHGDAGAPAYVGDDKLVGVVVSASGQDLCVDQLTLAVPGHGAYDEAMALSRP